MNRVTVFRSEFGEKGAYAIDSTGSVWVWGMETKNFNANTSTLERYLEPKKILNIKNIKGLSLAKQTALFLLKDGSVVVNGGQFDPDPSNKFHVSKLKNITHLHNAGDTAFFVTSTGNVMMVGKDSENLSEKSNGGTSSQYLAEPIQLEGFKGIVKAVGNKYGIVALDKNGHLWIKSKPRYKTTSDSGNIHKEYKKRTRPVIKIKLPKPAVDVIDARSGYLALLEDGTVYKFSTGIVFEPNTAYKYRTQLPTQILGLSQVVKIGKSAINTLDGNVYFTGNFSIDNDFLKKAHFNFDEYMKLPLDKATKVTDFIHDDHQTIGFLDTEGNAFFWGGNKSGQYGNGKYHFEITTENVFKPEKSLFNFYNMNEFVNTENTEPEEDDLSFLEEI